MALRSSPACREVLAIAINLPATDHGHEHEGGAVPHAHLTSVGIDIGSSTSHLMFSELTIGYPTSTSRRPEALVAV
jgi:hypothetical protein